MPTPTGTRPPRRIRRWLPLLVGNHPEYPSGHACITAAVTQSLQGYFGTKRVELTFTSNVVGAPKTYATLDEVVDAIDDARVWGGLHFRTTTKETAKHFRGSIATWPGALLRPAGHGGHEHDEDEDEDEGDD